MLILGVVIGFNNLAVSLALGALGRRPRRWRIVGVFMVFEFTVPLIGLLIGSQLAGAGADAGRAIGALLLAGLGAWTLWSSLESAEGERLAQRATTWSGLIGLAAGLSLDNLVVGFALGLGEASPLLVASVIAAFSAGFTLAGLEIGAQGRRRWERRTEIVAGLALIMVAVGVALGAIG